MLELVLTGRGIVVWSGRQRVVVLVLDRCILTRPPGADVALLVRRLREVCARSCDSVRWHVATMTRKADASDQREAVATVRRRCFRRFESSRACDGETLERTPTPGRFRLRSSVSASLNQCTADLRPLHRIPLAAWNRGVVRLRAGRPTPSCAPPSQAADAAKAAEQLAKQTGVS